MNQRGAMIGSVAEGESRYAPRERHPLVDKFERDLIASEPADYERSLRIFEAMWE